MLISTRRVWLVLSLCWYFVKMLCWQRIVFGQLGSSSHESAHKQSGTNSHARQVWLEDFQPDPNCV
jgi:uncharacterized membrane protein